METFYNGISFQTRLEARWAVFYDDLSITYNYWREVTHSDGWVSPSHFWLPEQHIFVLIKGSSEDGEATDSRDFEAEAVAVAKREKCNIYTFFGQIPIVESRVTLDYGDPNNDSAHVVYYAESEEEGGFDHYHAWCECPVCGMLDVQYGGRAARNSCGCLQGDRDHNSGSPRLRVAYKAATEAQVLGNKLFLAPTGVVYLLKSGPFYKIGKATDFSKRLGQIKLQLPYPVETVHVIKASDAGKTEKYWHQRFADKRAENGEWFLLTEIDIQEFASNILM